MQKLNEKINILKTGVEKLGLKSYPGSAATAIPAKSKRRKL